MNIGARVTIVHGWLSQNHGLVSGVLIARRDCNGQEVLTVRLDKDIEGRRIYTMFPEEIVAEGQWPNVYGDHVWPGMAAEPELLPGYTRTGGYDRWLPGDDDLSPVYTTAEEVIAALREYADKEE